MKKTINVIVIKNGRARHETISNELRIFQQIVGGRIETKTIGDVVIVCDEEWVNNGKEPTLIFGDETFGGDIVICGKGGKDGDAFGDVPRHIKVAVTEVENDETGHGDS